MQPIKELISKKRDGAPLAADEIRALIGGVADGAVSDAQLAAFAMATWFRGMDDDEQMALTLAMRDSGRVLEWPGLDGPLLDKHSTGGVGDLVSLVLAPVLAACGAFVPMISGRGLGHTGGTLDKLESIPGFDTAPDAGRLQALVREQGLAIVGQTAELVPADRRLYAIRDETGTVASLPLIVSSILSKKLAEGLDALVMDVKFGNGAVTVEQETARELAVQIGRVAHLAGLPCHVLLTDMNQPLAPAAGNSLEVICAVRFLTGVERSPRLQAVVLALCAEALVLGKLAENAAVGEAMARQALDSGRAAERFARMVTAQGGPAGLLEQPEHFLPMAPVVRPVLAPAAGCVTAIDSRALGLAVVVLGGGRQRAEDCIDPAVGLSALAPCGRECAPGDPLAVVHAASEADWERAAAGVRQAYQMGPQPPADEPAVLTVIEGGSDEPA